MIGRMGERLLIRLDGAVDVARLIQHVAEQQRRRRQRRLDLQRIDEEAPRLVRRVPAGARPRRRRASSDGLLRRDLQRLVECRGRFLDASRIRARPMPAFVTAERRIAAGRAACAGEQQDASTSPAEAAGMQSVLPGPFMEAITVETSSSRCYALYPVLIEVRMFKLMSVCAAFGMVAMAAALSAQGQARAESHGAQGRRHRAGVCAAGIRRQGPQAVGLQGQDRRAGMVPQSVHRWLNGRMQLAPCERGTDSRLRRRLFHGQRRHTRRQQGVR